MKASSAWVGNSENGRLRSSMFVSFADDVGDDDDKTNTGLRKYELKIGDSILLSACAFDGRGVGVFTCDSLSETCQSAIVRTAMDGSLEIDSPEGCLKSGTFDVVAAISEAEVAGATRRSARQQLHGKQQSQLNFGQPILLRHVLSGRFLCVGQGVASRTSGSTSKHVRVAAIPAEIHSDNLRLTLLPPSPEYVRRGDALPVDACLGACTFRFVPTVNHGRSGIFTDDLVFLVTNSQRLVRAGLLPPPLQLSESSRPPPRSTRGVETKADSTSNLNDGASAATDNLSTSLKRSRSHPSAWLFEAIGNAVREGVVLVDVGNAAACRRLYSSVAHEASVGRAMPKHKELLKKALGEAAEQAPGERDIVACFLLRRAFNTVVADAASPEDYGGLLPDVVAAGMVETVMTAALVTERSGSESATCKPFDSFESPLRFEADVSRVDLEQVDAASSSQGCFHWRLSLRVHEKNQSTRFLCTGDALRIKSLVSNALVWAPSAVHPLESDALRPRASAFQAVLHTIGDPSIGQQQHRRRGGNGADDFGDTSGTLPAVASFKGVFVVEALSGDRIDTPLEALQWGKPYRFRHLSSGAYLSVHLDSQKLAEEKEATGLGDIDNSLEFSVALVFPPGARGRRQCPSGREASRGPLGASRADAEDGDDGEEDELSDFPVRKEGSLFSEAQEEELFNQATALRLVPAMLAAVSSSSSSSLSSTPSNESFIRADASLGWLQATVDPQLLRAAAITAEDENSKKMLGKRSQLKGRGLTSHGNGQVLTVTLHDTHTPVFANADWKRTLQCMLPVATSDHEDSTFARSGSFEGSAPPVPLPGNEGLEREVAANRGLAFVRGRAAADVVQLQRVAPELVSIGRLGLVALRRLVAFESWLRHLDPAVLANVLADAEDKRPGVDYISRRPSLEAAALKASRPKLFPEAPSKPLLELTQFLVSILSGKAWPDLSPSHILHGTGEGGSGNSPESVAASLACERAYSAESGDHQRASGGGRHSRLTPAVLTRRIQSLMRETPLLAIPFFLKRAFRSAGASTHLARNEPPHLRLLGSCEAWLKAMIHGNAQSQVAVACGRFMGRRRIIGYHPGLCAEIFASTLEWGESEYAEQFRSGRPNLMLQTLIFDNPELNSAMVDESVARFLCKIVSERGMDNHTVALLGQACCVSENSGGIRNGSVVNLTQDRVFNAWLAAVVGNKEGGEKVIIPLLGMFFVRKPEKDSPISEADSGVTAPSRDSADGAVPMCSQSSNDLTYENHSLMQYGSDRIFRLCVAFTPPEVLRQQVGDQHWCLSCHLDNRRHRHGECFFSEEEQGVGEFSVRQFLAAGNSKTASKYYANDPIVADRLLDEVVQWSHHAHKKETLLMNGEKRAEDQPFVDLALLRRLSRTSPEHARTIKYLQAFLNLWVSLAKGQRTQVKKMIQMYFPYELLLLGLNFFSLGPELRSSFASLMGVLYLDRYPHFAVPTSPPLRLVGNDIDAGCDQRKRRHQRNCRRKVQGQSMDNHSVFGGTGSSRVPVFSPQDVRSLLPKFGFSGHHSAIHTGANISLGGLFVGYAAELLVAPTPSHSGDEFVFRSCSKKFALLIQSVLDSLRDDRLLALVGADAEKWADEHLSAMGFLQTLLTLMSQLADYGFLDNREILLSLARTLFRLKDSLERDTQAISGLRKVSGTGKLSHLRSKIASSTALRDKVRAPPSAKKENPAAATSGRTRQTAQEASTKVPTASVKFMETEAEMVQGNDSLMERVSQIQRNKITKAVDREETKDTSSVTSTSTSIDQSSSFEDEDEDLKDEVMAIAHRRRLSLRRLGLTFGEGNAAALLVHDEPRPERAADIVVEVERFTLGQGWHHSPKVVPFECATNSELANLYCLDVTSARSRDSIDALRQSSLVSPQKHDAGSSRFGPGKSLLSQLGLPFPGGDGDVGQSLSTWQWLEPWRRMGAGDGDGKDDGSWEYSRAPPYDPAASWTPGPARFGHIFRRRHWRRRRERKGALNLCVELLREGWADLSSVRHAIRAAREFAHSEAERRQGERDAVRNQQREDDASSGEPSMDGSGGGDGGMRGQDERTLDLGHLMRHVKALKASGDISENGSGRVMGETESKLPWLADPTLLDLSAFSMLLDMKASSSGSDFDLSAALASSEEVHGSSEKDDGKARHHLDEDKETQRLLDAEAAALLKKKQRGLKGAAEAKAKVLDELDRKNCERVRLLCFTEVVRLLNRLQDTASHVRCGALLTSFQDRFAPCSAASASVALKAQAASTSAQQSAAPVSSNVRGKVSASASTSKNTSGNASCSPQSNGSTASTTSAAEQKMAAELDPRRVYLLDGSDIMLWRPSLMRFFTIIGRGFDPGLEGPPRRTPSSREAEDEERPGSSVMFSSKQQRNAATADGGEVYDVSRGLRVDGSARGALEHRGDLRLCALFIKRLHRAFTAAEVEPATLIGRFADPYSQFAVQKAQVPKNQQFKPGYEKQKKKQWASAPSTTTSLPHSVQAASKPAPEPLNLVTFQWLLAGIGYSLTPLDTDFLLRYFLVNDANVAAPVRGNESGGGRSGSRGGSMAESFAVLKRGTGKDQQEDSLARERRQVEAAKAARIAREAAAAAVVVREQRQVVALDAAKLLLCLDAVPPELEPVLSAQGVELFESMFREAGAPRLDAFSLASRHYLTSPAKAPSPRSTSFNSTPTPTPTTAAAAATKGVVQEENIGTASDPTGCGAGVEQALLSLYRTFDEAANMHTSGRVALGANEQAFALSQQTLALLFRAFRTRQEFLGSLTATDVVDRPDVDSPDGVFPIAGSGGVGDAGGRNNEVQRAIGLLRYVCSRLKDWQHGGSGGSTVRNVKGGLQRVTTLFQFLTTTIIKRRRDAGGNTRASLARFQFTLANAGVAAAALQVITTPALWGVVDDDSDFSAAWDAAMKEKATDAAAGVPWDASVDKVKAAADVAMATAEVKREMHAEEHKDQNNAAVSPSQVDTEKGPSVRHTEGRHQREVLVDTTEARAAASRFMCVLLCRAPEAVATKLVTPHFYSLVTVDERLGDGESHTQVGAISVLTALLSQSPPLCCSFPESVLLRFARLSKSWALRLPPRNDGDTSAPINIDGGIGLPGGGSESGGGRGFFSRSIPHSSSARCSGCGDHMGLSVDTLAYLRLFEVLLITTPVAAPAVQARVFRVLSGENVVATFCDPHFQGPLAEEPGYLYRRGLLERTQIAPPMLKMDAKHERNQSADASTQKMLIQSAPRQLCVGPDHFALARHALGLRLLALCCQGTHHGACVATLACAQLLPLTTICSLLRELTAECIDPEAVNDLSTKHTLAYAKVRVTQRKAVAAVDGAWWDEVEGGDEDEDAEVRAEKKHVQHDLLSVYRGVGLSVGPWGHTRVLSSLAFFLTKVYLTHAAAPESRNDPSTSPVVDMMGEDVSDMMDSDRANNDPSSSASSSPQVWCLPALKNTEAHALLAWTVDCGGLVRSLAHKVRRHEVFSATAAGAESMCLDLVMGRMRAHTELLWPNLEDPATNSAESVRLVLGSIIPALSALYNLLRLGQKEQGTADNQGGRGSMDDSRSAPLRMFSSGRNATKKNTGVMGAAHRKAWNKVYSSLSRLLVGPSSRQPLSSSSPSCRSSSVRHLQRLCSAVSPCVRDDLDRDWLPCAWKLMERLADDAMVDLDSFEFDTQEEVKDVMSVEEEDEYSAAAAAATAETEALMDAGADEEEAAELQPVVDLAEVADSSGARVNFLSLYSHPDHHVASDIHSLGTDVSSLHSGGCMCLGFSPEICADAPMRALFGRFGHLRSVVVRRKETQRRPLCRRTMNSSSNGTGASRESNTDDSGQNSSTGSSANGSSFRNPFRGSGSIDEGSVVSGDGSSADHSAVSDSVNSRPFTHVNIYFDAVRGLTEHFTPGRELKILSEEEEQLAQDPDGAGVDGMVNVELLCLPTGKVVEDFPVLRAERVTQILEHIGCQVVGGISPFDLRLSVDGFEVTQNLRFGAILAWLHGGRPAAMKPLFGMGTVPSPVTPRAKAKVVVTWTPAMAACRACDGVDPRFLATVATATLAAEARKAKQQQQQQPPSAQRVSGVFQALYQRAPSTATTNTTTSGSAASTAGTAASNPGGEKMLSLGCAPRSGINPVTMLVEDSGIDSFWRGFVNACASSQAIAASVEAETKRLVAFVFDLPRLSGLQFTFPGVVFTLVQHARNTLRSKQKGQQKGARSADSPSPQHREQQPQQDQQGSTAESPSTTAASTESPTAASSESTNDEGTCVSEHLGHVCDLLQRLMTNAVPGTPLPLGVKWAGVRPPQTTVPVAPSSSSGPSPSPSSSSSAQNRSSGVKKSSTPLNHRQRLGHRPVVDDKVREEVGPEETSRRQMQALIVECGAVELVVEVLGELGSHTNCFRMALELGLAIFEGGNLHAQERLYGFLVRTQDFAFAASISDVVRTHARWHERRAAARAALGLPELGASQTGVNMMTLKMMSENGGPIPSPLSVPIDVSTSVDASVFLCTDANAAGGGSGEAGKSTVAMVLHLAQLFCEGHHRGLQNILRDCRGTTAAAAAAAATNPAKGMSSDRRGREEDTDDDSDSDSGDEDQQKKGTTKAGKKSQGSDNDSDDDESDEEPLCTDSFATSWMRALDEPFSVNFIEAVIELVGAIVGPDLFSYRLTSQRADAFVTLHSCLRFLVEAMQGPNPENQWAVVSHGSGALVRCLNRINVFIVALHPMSNHADFIRLWGGITAEANLVLQAVLEGRPRSMDDPTSRLLYETVSPSAFQQRLDLLAMLIKYLDKKRRSPQLKRVDHNAAAANKKVTAPTISSLTAKLIGEGSGRRQMITFSEAMSSRLESNGLAVLPATEDLEPEWQHDYDKEPHLHNLMYVGPMMVVAANALHALEAPSGGNRFNILPYEVRRSTTSSSSSGSSSASAGGAASSSENGQGRGDRRSNGGDDAAASDGGDDDDDNAELDRADRLANMTVSTAAETSGSSWGAQSDGNTPQARSGGSGMVDDGRGGRDGDHGGLAHNDEFAEFVHGFRKFITLPALRRHHFTDSVLSIEVQFGPEHGLVQVFFPRPAVVAFLTEQQQLDTHEKLDYTLDDAQVLRDFFRQRHGITNEIRHRRRLAEIYFVGTFLKVTTNSAFEVVAWALSMVINFMVLIAVRRNKADSRFHFEPPEIKHGVVGMGALLLLVNLAILVSTVALQAPLLWAALKRRATDASSRELRLGPVRPHEVRLLAAKAFFPPLLWAVGLLVALSLIKITGVDAHSPELRSVNLLLVVLVVPFLRASRKLLENRPFFLHQWARVFVFIYDTCTFEGLDWKLIFTIVNIMALDNNPLLFSLQILSVLNFSSTLRNVVRAVRGPIAQLSMTCFFGILVIYIFMVIAFWAFPSDLEDNSGYYSDSVAGSGGESTASGPTTMCSSMIACYAMFLVNGLSTGGGIGEFISAELGNAPSLTGEKTIARFAFDLAFFVVVTIGLLNLIFGIIIDTFSSLREKANEEKTLMENKCTICGLTRQEFERRESGGWQRHYKHEHNVWSYYAYLVHLQTKPATEFTGLEDFVAAKVAQRSLAWLPRHRALALEQQVE